MLLNVENQVQNQTPTGQSQMTCYFVSPKETTVQLFVSEVR